MSHDPSEPERDPSPPSTGQAATGAASSRAEGADPDPAVPAEERRGIGEWAVVLLLVALIVGVAWSQFGGLFDTSTAGTGAAPPGGIEVEADGVTLGGTPMSSLTGGVNTNSTDPDEPEE